MPGSPNKSYNLSEKSPKQNENILSDTSETADWTTINYRATSIRPNIDYTQRIDPIPRRHLKPKIEFFLITPQNKLQASKAFVKIHFHPHQSTMACFGMIDSGSEASILTQKYLDSLNLPNLKITDCKVKMSTFGGQIIIAYKQFTVTMSFHKSNKKLAITFLIDPNRDIANSIIGQDVLRKFRLDVNVATINSPDCVLQQNILNPATDDICTPLFTNTILWDNCTGKTNSLKRTSVPYFMATIGNDDYRIMADSGAVKNICENWVIEKMGRTHEIVPARKKLYGAAAEVDIIGFIILNMILTAPNGNITVFNTKFWIALNAGEDLSIGFNFFILNNIIHSNSENAMIDSNRQIITRYFYPRDIPYVDDFNPSPMVQICDQKNEVVNEIPLDFPVSQNWLDQCKLTENSHPQQLTTKSDTGISYQNVNQAQTSIQKASKPQEINVIPKVININPEKAIHKINIESASNDNNKSNDTVKITNITDKNIISAPEVITIIQAQSSSDQPNLQSTDINQSKCAINVHPPVKSIKSSKPPKSNISEVSILNPDKLHF